MPDPQTTSQPRKVFIPYIEGRIYQTWGGEPLSIMTFLSAEAGKAAGFSDLREVQLWGIS